MPSFARQLMPAALLNATIRNSGTRMLWMKSHVCPCTLATLSPGTADPACNTCHGRGRYWDQPQGPYTLLRTFMHTSEAADEPGALMDPRTGQELHAEPTITIPSDLTPIWADASEFDAYVEIDSLLRFETAFVVGQNTVLPYQQGLSVQSVSVYDTVGKRVQPLSTANYTVNNGLVTLIGYPGGTSFTVSYKANPVYIAWRRAGAMAHTRVFGGGTDPLPTRFRAQWLDMWLRARNQFGQSASPDAL